MIVKDEADFCRQYLITITRLTCAILSNPHTDPFVEMQITVDRAIKYTHLIVDAGKPENEAKNE
jgi:hypothetical protein